MVVKVCKPAVRLPRGLAQALRVASVQRSLAEEDVAQPVAVVAEPPSVKRAVRLPKGLGAALRVASAQARLPDKVIQPVKRAIRLPKGLAATLRLSAVQPYRQNPVAPVRKTVARLSKTLAASLRQIPPVYSREPAPIRHCQRGVRLSRACAETLRLAEKARIISQVPLLQPERFHECDMQLKRIVEAILFAADKPMSVKQIQQVFPELEQPDAQAIQEAIVSIMQDYADRPIGLKMLASGYRFQVKEGLAYWVSRIFEEKPARYSRALLETIAIIAYRQPVTRGEIEEIRGVAVSTSIIQTLLEREWVRVIAYKESPGRPALYGTTKQFLDYFNLSTLAELPALEDLIHQELQHSPLPQVQQDNSERPQTDTPETSTL